MFGTIPHSFVNVNSTASVSETMAAQDQITNESLKQVQMAHESAILEKYRKMENDKNQIDIRTCCVVALVGGLVGVILGVLVFQEGNVNVSYVLWGLMIGGCGGFILAAMYLYLNAYSNQAYRKEADAKREAMRRQEQMEQEEKHKEFVYYDASTSHSLIFRFLCCPHFGKITSERIIYSDYVRSEWKATTVQEYCASVFHWIASFWWKKVEQID